MHTEVSERLLISLIGGVGIASEELDNVKTQVFSLAKLYGILDEVPTQREPDQMYVMTIPDRPVRRWLRRSLFCGLLILIGFLAGQLVQEANADHDWLAAGPPVMRVVKTFDGHFYAVTVTRAQPGSPYTEWTAQREISESDVAEEVIRLRGRTR